MDLFLVYVYKKIINDFFKEQGLAMDKTMNATDILEQGIQIYFGWIDFIIFGFMLVFSALIGVYFGCWEKKLDSRVDYLFGGKTMQTLPVAVSLVARYDILLNLKIMK